MICRYDIYNIYIYQTGNITLNKRHVFLTVTMTQPHLEILESLGYSKIGAQFRIFFTL